MSLGDYNDTYRRFKEIYMDTSFEFEPMLGVDNRFESWLSASKYKPNWTFTVNYDPGMATFRLRIVVETLDSNCPDKRTMLVRDSYIPESLTTLSDFRHWLHHEIRAVEDHEIDEWFRDARTEQPINDPHPELR